MLPKSPFDTIASGYDHAFTETAVGRLQRAIVWAYLEPKIRPGLSVLELNCGTGADAVWLARHGCRVLATDRAPDMVAIAAAKAEQTGLEHLIQTQVLDLRNLGSDIGATRYDLILSNFGGLNCLSPDELTRFGNILRDRLNPGGMFVAVVMGRFCAWETVYFLLKGRLRTAFRRLNGGPVVARLDDHTSVPTWYYSPAEIRRYFSALALQAVQPVGCWLPPSYLDPWFSRRLALLRVLNTLETKCRGRLWAWKADHFAAVFTRS